MSTSGIIAQPTGKDTWDGVYHHSDSYPTGLGASLWVYYHGHFKRDVEAMRQYFIRDHPAGWSFAVDVDLAKPVWGKDPPRVYPDDSTGKPDYSQRTPDYVDYLTRARCYCHWEGRNEKAQPITSKDDGGFEWYYILADKALYVLESRGFKRPPGREVKGYSVRDILGKIQEYPPSYLRTTPILVAAWDDPEPDWKALEENPKVSRRKLNFKVTPPAPAPWPEGVIRRPAGF